MQFSGHKTINAVTASKSWPETRPESPTRAWPALCGFAVAMICFGAARIHASGSIPTSDKIPTWDKAAEHRAMGSTGATTTRMVDFKPHAFAPSAFADWADAPATAR